MKEQTAVFIGHRECYGVTSDDVAAVVRELIAKGVKEFLCGGMATLIGLLPGLSIS